MDRNNVENTSIQLSEPGVFCADLHAAVLGGNSSKDGPDNTER